MIINHTHKFIFIHIPKAAGTTVADTLSSLSRYCDQEIGGTEFGEMAQLHYWTRFGLRKHSPAKEVMNAIGRDAFTGFFRFAFVRNPYTRLASSFHFLKAWNSPEFSDALDQYPDFESFLESNAWTSSTDPDIWPDGVFRPQTFWLKDRQTGELLVDFIGKTENLSQDLQAILTRIGGSSAIVRDRSNPTPVYTRPKVWSSEIVARIQREYRCDFEAFGYDSSPPS